MNSRIGAVVIFAVLCGIGACSKTPTSPSNSAIAGTWAGDVNDTLVGASTLKMTIADSNAGLSGTWTSSSIGSGTLTGSLSGTTVQLMLKSNVTTSCSFAITATLTGTQMTGTDTSQTCAAGASGTVTLTRQ